MSSLNGDPSWIALDGAVNARAVVPGVLLRSDNLQSLSERDMETLIDEYSLRVVLDLRTDVEVRLEGAGPLNSRPEVRVEHRSLYPDSGDNTDIELDALRPWQRPHGGHAAEERPVVRAYLSYVHRRPDSIVGAIRAIADADGAALVHCAAGKDRTGVVVALALDAAGFEPDAIVADYLASADRIEAIRERLLGSATYRPGLEGLSADQLAPKPGTMERFFELVDEQLGGSAALLSANGLEPDELDRLRSRLTAGARTT